MTLGATMAGIEAVRTMLSESAECRAFLGVATPAEALEKIYTHYLPDEDLKNDTLAERKARRPWSVVTNGSRYEIRSNGAFQPGRIFTSTAVVFERMVDLTEDLEAEYTAFLNEIDGMTKELQQNQSQGSLVDISYAPGGEPLRFEESTDYPAEVPGERPQPFVVFCCRIEVQLNGGVG